MSWHKREKKLSFEILSNADVWKINSIFIEGVWEGTAEKSWLHKQIILNNVFGVKYYWLALKLKTYFEVQGGVEQHFAIEYVFLFDILLDYFDRYYNLSL